MKIKITVGDVELTATLLENQTAQTIYDALPFDFPYTTWGDEIYFGIPVTLDVEEGRELMDIGELAYWPPGHAFCIFYGPTPASTDDKPRAASEVTPIGTVDGDITILKKAKVSTIKVEPLED